jgi:hypothetical protein
MVAGDTSPSPRVGATLCDSLKVMTATLLKDELTECEINMMTLSSEELETEVLVSGGAKGGVKGGAEIVREGERTVRCDSDVCDGYG